MFIKNIKTNFDLTGELIDSESLRDTLIDLHNYSAMAIMLIDEQRQKNETDMK